jgi:cholesterol transport system auxiliary component
MKKIIFLILLFSSLMGCSVLAPLSKPPKTYLLNNVTIENYTKSKSQKTLLVSQITSNSWLDTSHMAYQLNDNEINYFAENQWIAPPAELLQPIIINALISSNLYRAVVPAPFNGNYDQRLEIQLLEMQQNFIQKPSVYEMTLQVQLVDRVSQKIINSQRFHIIAPALTDNPEGGVIAADRAVEEFIAQLVQFLKYSHVKKS